MLFVDVTGSTRLYEALGDERAHTSIEGHLRRIEAAVNANGGHVVKHLGDGLMCAFPDASAAVRAAQAFQQELAARAHGTALAVHAGCHHGPVLETAGDLFGDSVNVAARVAGLAKPGQVIVTRDAADRLDDDLRRSVRRLGHAGVKGRREPIEILEYLWECERAEDLTLIRHDTPDERVSGLRLFSRGRESWFDGGGAGALTLGRDAASDVVVVDRAASRRHARIERRGNHFVLVDHSANGTFVAIAGDAERCLLREEATLRGRGRIALGRPTTDANATIVEFRCEPSRQDSPGG